MDKVKAISIFVEVADSGSFSAAAQRLGVVNSVVSKNISELEQWLGKKLVYRSTRSMRLTQDGLKCLPEMETVLAQLDAMESRLAEKEGVLRGSVSMTAPMYLGQHHLLPIVTEFKALHPEVDIYLNLSDRRVDIIEQGYDLALRVSQMPDSDFVSRRLRNMVLKLVASPSYIDNHGKPGLLEALKTHHCLIEGDRVGSTRWRFKDERGRRRSVAVTGKTQSNLGESIKGFCLAGQGIAQLPSFFVDGNIASGELIELLPEFALDDFYIHLLYQKAASSNAAVAALIKFVYGRF